MQPPSAAIQRGFDNAVANWPLLLIRIAENAALLALVVITIFGAIFPIGLFGAFGGLDDLESAEDLADAIVGVPLLLALYVFAVLSIALIIAVIIHSFVQGGVAGCYVEGERQARASSGADRGRFKTFTPEKWYRYARRDWWPIFLIYNVTWGAFGLLCLVPLLVLAAGIYLGRESEQIVFFTCAGLVVVFLFLLVGGFVVHLWSTTAIVLRSSGKGLGEALSEGWRTTAEKAIPLVLLAIIALVVSFAAAGSIGFASFGVGLVSSLPGLGLATLPVQIGISFLQTAVSIAVYSWFLAAVVSVVLR